MHNIEYYHITNMIKEKALKTKNWIVNRFKKKETMISCLVFLVTFSLIFSAGVLSNETKDEKCADYYSQIALNHTIGGGDKNLAGLLVEPKADGGASMAYDTQSEINNIWGAFKGENASFAPVINANKEVDIRFVGEEGEKYGAETLSILYSTVGVMTEPYHYIEQINEETKEKEKVPIDYKFQCSPLATMFQSSRYGWQTDIYIYISQKHAENKLRSEGKEVNENTLRSLLDQTVDIDFGGEVKTCIIQNIYLDNFKHVYSFPYPGHKYNYYYGTDVGTILNDYIFISFYATKSEFIPKCLSAKQGMYFMSEYSYRNRFYLEYARDCYSPTDYSFKYVTSNLKEGFIPDEAILRTAVNAVGTSVGCALLTTLISLMFVANLVFMFLFKLYMSPLSIVLVGVSSIAPYLLFRLIFVITKNVSIFSSYSTILNTILLIVMAISIFTLIIFSKTLKKKESTNV